MLPGEVLASDLKDSSTFLRVSIPCQCSMNNGSEDVILETPYKEKCWSLRSMLRLSSFVY